MGDDMFNYYSSNRDSHTEDNSKNEPYKRKSKAISKNKLTKRFDKNNKMFDCQNENIKSKCQTFQGLKSEQIIIENMDEQENINSNKKSQKFNISNRNFNSLAKNFEEEGDTDDSEFQFKKNPYVNFEKKQKSLEIKKKLYTNTLKNNQPAIRIEDVYSSVEESVQIQLNQFPLDDLQNSYDLQSLNSYRNEFSSPTKDKKQSIQDDQIQDDEYQEEEKQNGDPIEGNENQNQKNVKLPTDLTQNDKTLTLVENTFILQEPEQAKQGEQLNINDNIIQYQKMFSEELKKENNNESQEINLNDNMCSSVIKSQKKTSPQKGVQFSFNSYIKSEKQSVPIKTPSINIHTEEKQNETQYFTGQQQQSGLTIKQNVPLFNSQLMLQSQPQLQMEDSSQKCFKTSFYSQIRRVSSRRQSHRKTRFMNEMKNYISHWNQDDFDENKQMTYSINETAVLNSRKYHHEQTRSLLIPSEITELQYSYKKNQSQQNESNKAENINKSVLGEHKQKNKNLFDKVVIDQNALFLDQNFSPIMNSRENLQKLYRSGIIKSASICAFPSIQPKQQSNQVNQNTNSYNYQQNKENINLQETEQVQLQRSLVLSNYKMSSTEQDDYIKNKKEFFSQKDDENQEECFEILNKSKAKDEIQMNEINKQPYSIHGDELDRQQFFSQNGENVQFSNIIQSLQNGLKNQCMNPEYESISEMLHQKQRNNAKEYQIDRSCIRHGTQIQKSTRKDPYEEFFNLTAQTVKLNSSYFDVISSINIAPFYEEVKKLQIPFNKWQEFLVQKFEEVHDKMKQLNKLKKTYKIQLEQNQQKNGSQLELCSIIQQSYSNKKSYQL